MNSPAASTSIVAFKSMGACRISARTTGSELHHIRGLAVGVGRASGCTGISRRKPTKGVLPTQAGLEGRRMFQLLYQFVVQFVRLKCAAKAQRLPWIQGYGLPRSIKNVPVVLFHTCRCRRQRVPSRHQRGDEQPVESGYFLCGFTTGTKDKSPRVASLGSVPGHRIDCAM